MLGINARYYNSVSTLVVKICFMRPNKSIEKWSAYIQLKIVNAYYILSKFFSRFIFEISETLLYLKTTECGTI